MKSQFRIFFKNLNGIGKITRIVIDEAHNVVHSHYYRPAYGSMGWMLKDLPVTLLSATIPQDKKFIEDLNNKLEIESLLVRSNVVCRPELSIYITIKKTEKEARSLLDRLVSNQDGNIIIYSPTKKLCDDISELIIGSRIYHADMTHEARNDVESWWFDGNLKKVLVATSAFGEGIDSPNVTLVVNYLIVHSMLDGMQQVKLIFFFF